jgi:hypothetical protein
MKVTKDNLKKFVFDWERRIDEEAKIMSAYDVLYDLQRQFNLLPKRSKTLMEVFAEEEYNNYKEDLDEDLPF